MVDKSANTGSTLALDKTNKTSTGISTNILIMVNDTPVGAVQTMSIQEKRNIKMVDEVGTDGHIDSVPNQSTNITGSCQRIRFDRLRIAEAFSRGFIHVASQVYPFDIMIIDRQKRNTGSNITTVIKNVWINGIDYTYQVSDWVITENMTWEAETIFSTRDGGKPAATGGERGIIHMAGPLSDSASGIKGVLVSSDGSGKDIEGIEQLTDTGARRGSLDASGLIDLGLDDAALF